MDIKRLFLILMGRSRLILFTFLVTVVTTAVITLLLPRTYTSTADLIFDFNAGNPAETSSFVSQQIPAYMNTQVEIISSPAVALKVVDRLGLADDPNAQANFAEATEGKGSVRHWVAGGLLRNLDVNQEIDSSTMGISYSSNDSARAAEMANAFTDAYIETNLQFRVEPARKSAEWFENQLTILRNDLRADQQALFDYQQETGIVGTDESADVQTARLAQISEQLVAVQEQGFEAQSQLAQLEQFQEEGRPLESIPAVISNPLISSLKGDLSSRQIELSRVAGQLGSNHPEYQRAAAEVGSARSALNEEINRVTEGIINDANIAERREAELIAALEEQKSSVLGLKGPRGQLDVYVQNVEDAQRSYDAALENLNQVSLQSQLNQSNVSVLNEAVEPINPSQPKIFMNMALAIFFGGVLGVGIALMIEMTRRYVRSEEDLSEALALPVLGLLERSR